MVVDGGARREWLTELADCEGWLANRSSSRTYRQPAFAKATAGNLRVSHERRLAERVGFVPDDLASINGLGLIKSAQTSQIHSTIRSSRAAYLRNGGTKPAIDCNSRASTRRGFVHARGCGAHSLNFLHRKGHVDLEPCLYHGLFSLWRSSEWTRDLSADGLRHTAFQVQRGQEDECLGALLDLAANASVSG